MRKPMSTNERHHFPFNAWLEDYRNHCEEVHGATSGDYRMNVAEWHKENFPECVTAPRIRGRR